MSLSFDELRVANVTRCEASFHPVADWSPTDWACAMAGEVGEACNLVKKLRRGEPIPLADIGDELADVVAYLDLLAARLGIDLGGAVARKFNSVSQRVGSDLRLPETARAALGLEPIGCDLRCVTCCRQFDYREQYVEIGYSCARHAPGDIPR